MNAAATGITRILVGTVVWALLAGIVLDAAQRAAGKVRGAPPPESSTAHADLSRDGRAAEAGEALSPGSEFDGTDGLQGRFSEKRWLRYQPVSNESSWMPRWYTLGAERSKSRARVERFDSDATSRTTPDATVPAGPNPFAEESPPEAVGLQERDRRALPKSGQTGSGGSDRGKRGPASSPSAARGPIRQVNWQPQLEPDAEPGETAAEFPDQTSDPAPPPDGFLPSPNLAAPPEQVRIPLSGPDLSGRVQLSSENGRISLIVRDAPIGYVLELLAKQQGLNIVAGHDVLDPISVTLSQVSFEDALDAILSVAGYTWVRHRNIILITRVERDTRVLPQAQGRELRVFPLSFVAAADVQPVVEGLLSPVGRAFAVRTDPLDNRRTREQMVVEDLPMYLMRVAEYIAQVDQPPRQVLVEAHVLEISLTDETRHGVNFEYISQLANADIALRTQGFANPAASPAFIFDLDATELDAVVEALKTTTDSKTLASPKVLVLNGQEARIQIGEQLGYFVTTTTETSTLQNVNFLELGVVLRVTPTISEDNQILLSVRPEVSSGQINETTGLPEENTTEVDTTVLLPDGHGMVIGGLIKEDVKDTQIKVPIIGSLWVVGNLFKRRTVSRERNEIVIVLIPRIVPYTCDYQMREDAAVGSATTRLTYGPLERVPRPWEPRLPDACDNPRWLKWNRLPDLFRSVHDPYPLPLEHYLPAADEVGTFHGDLLELD